MIHSIRSLAEAPYNKKHPFFALKRFVHWKFIRAFKIKNIHYRIWDNRTLIIDYDSLQSMWIMYNYILDWEEFNLISAYVQPGDQLLDVGANIGAYSLWMSKFIAQPGKLHSFEPDKGNFHKLEENISLSNAGGLIIVNQCALSDVDGTLNFTTGLDRLNHIADGSETGVVSVLSQKLDTYFKLKAIERVTYMKIDVEGFEYTVLKGAHEILSEKRIEIIQLEINNAINNAGLTVEELLKLLAGYNYSICRYDVETRRLIPTDFVAERENYFAVADIIRSNQKLQSNTEGNS